jgi:hypothetical protein
MAMSREQYRKGQFLRGGNFPLIRNGALDDTDAPTAARAKPRFTEGAQQMKPPARIVPRLLELDANGILRWQPRDRKFFRSEGSLKSWHSKHAGKPALTYTNKRGQQSGKLLGQSVYARAVLACLANGTVARHEPRPRHAQGAV